MRLNLIAWTIASLSATISVSLIAQDWAHWRGPNQNGVSAETGLVDSFSLENNENVLWTSDIGGRSTPIILNDRVYINCRTEENIGDPVEKINAQEQVVCFDANTGDIVWKDRFNVFQSDIPQARIGWAAMCGDSESGNVYVHSVSGIFRCYSGDGKVLWEHSLLEEYGKISGYGGRTQTPIIDENRVIVSFLTANWGETKGPGPQHSYYAFDKKTGDLLWVASPGGAPDDTNYSVPFVTVIDGKRMLIGGNGDGGIYAMLARTGAKIWGFDMSLRGLNSSAVSDGKHVFIAHGEDNIDNTEFGRVQCIDATGTGNVTKTHSVWRHDGLKAGYTGLVVKDGVLYVVSDLGNMNAFDSKTGEPLWEFDLGTVGKGSPIWADGKIYVMEVNGNIHILKANREGCEPLCRVHLHAKDGNGDDEIYASPAVSNGRIVFVTRDRTICIGKKRDKKGETDKIVLDAETPATDEVASIQLWPYEVALMSSESVEYTAVSFDKNGREIARWKPDLQASEPLKSLTVESNKITAPELDHDMAGTISVEKNGITATARVRVFNADKVWKWNFDSYQGVDVPPTWIRAFAKMKATDIDGNVGMKLTGMAKGRPGHYVWLGRPDMSGYTIQADVSFEEQKRLRPKVGITANRYNLVIKADDLPEELKRDRKAKRGTLVAQSWAPHLRMAKIVHFPVEPKTWYTLKLKVEIHEDGAHVFGKAWLKGDAEPEEWTLQTVDPKPNLTGSPGLYVSALADCYYDNVTVEFSNE